MAIAIAIQGTGVAFCLSEGVNKHAQHSGGHLTQQPAHSRTLTKEQHNSCSVLAVKLLLVLQVFIFYHLKTRCGVNNILYTCK